GGALIDGPYLAGRVRRYLVQHPYVRTLTINAFNPGRAAVLGEMLLELQKDPAFAQLRYDIRLFVPDPDATGVGEEIAALLTTRIFHAYLASGTLRCPAQRLRSQLRTAGWIFARSSVSLLGPRIEHSCIRFTR